MNNSYRILLVYCTRPERCYKKNLKIEKISFKMSNLIEHV